MDDITVEDLGKVDIEKIAFNRDKLGTLVFEKSAPQLVKLQDLANEFDSLDYKNNLSLPEVQLVDNFKSYLVDRLRELTNFDIQQTNAKDIHDQFENNIENYYNSILQQLRSALVYLRQEISLKNSDKKELKRQQEEAQRARYEFEMLKDQYNQQMQGILKEKEDLEKGRGQLAATKLEKYFGHEILENIKSANKWNKYRWGFFIAIGIVLVINFVGYMTTFILGNKMHYWQFETTEIFNLEYAVAKLALLILLSYGLVFCSKQYSIHSNLAAVNRHRRNVANTLDDYLGTNPDSETKSQIIKQGAEAMFRHFPTGYIGKVEAKDSAPVTEVITGMLRV